MAEFSLRERCAINEASLRRFRAGVGGVRLAPLARFGPARHKPRRMATLPAPIPEFANRVLRRPRLAALVLGALAATGFQPLALWPVTLAALVALLALIARADNAKRAALLGWLFGVGHFSVGNTWIATAFTYQAAMPAAMGWVAVFGLALYLAVYPLLAALAAWLIAGRAGRITWPLVLAFAGSWAIAEWLRSWVFSGYVWNPLGVVALGGFARPGLASVLPWLGTYALSAVVIVFAGGWWIAARALSRSGTAAMQALRVGGLSAAAVMVWMIGPDFGPRDAPTALAFTLVQPDTRQQDLDDPAKYDAQFVTTAALTEPGVTHARRLVLWPESGIPDLLRGGYPGYFYAESTYGADPALARGRIARVIGKGSLLLTGAVDLVLHGDRVVGARNVVTALGDDAAIRASYAKAHLVPGGEYLPLRSLLAPLGLTRLVAGALDFLPGPGPRTLDFGRVSAGGYGRAGIQICYEIIFSGQVVDRANRPDYIFNPSNDGWFGASGPPQHLAQARLRAIEEGLPVLRATTTGVSAVVDADGVVRQTIPRLQAGRIEGFVPPAHPPTLFARLGNILPLGWAIVLIAAALLHSKIALRPRRG